MSSEIPRRTATPDEIDDAIALLAHLLDAERLRAIATTIMLGCARDADPGLIRGYLHNHDPAFRSADGTARQAAVDSVSELISKATITVSFPGVPTDAVARGEVDVDQLRAEHAEMAWQIAQIRALHSPPPGWEAEWSDPAHALAQGWPVCAGCRTVSGCRLIEDCPTLAILNGKENDDG